MGTETAKKTVLVSTLLLAGIAVYRADKAGQGSLYKRLWGAGVLSLVLDLVADFAPQIAGPFAALVVLGSITRGGDKAIQNFLGSASGAASTAKGA